MNILVSGYLDNNLGDNIMLETLIRYLEDKGIKCYLLADNDFTYTYILDEFPEVKIISSLNPTELRLHDIKGFIKISGSMFQHNTLKEGIFRYITLRKYKKLKNLGIKVYFMSCNVGPFTNKFGIRATKKILKLANMITCRDEMSFEFIKKQNKDAHLFYDIVFSRKDLAKDTQSNSDILGISVFTSNVNKAQKNDLAYCKLMSSIADEYLDSTPDGKVNLFVFNTGYNTDFPSAFRILKLSKNKDRINIVGFDGDIDGFMKEFNKCSVIIGARFHSIVLSVLCNIPVVPVIYSNKSTNLLSDLKYIGPKIDMVDSKKICSKTVVNDIKNKENLLFNIDPNIYKNSDQHLKTLGKYLENDIDI